MTAQPKLKILCVEDEQALREDIREELEDAGYDVYEASDGREGLHKIVEIKPDLVVSDITMPNMTGDELVTSLRKNHPNFAEMPFIFLSALADRQHVLQGMQTGADDYLTKPVDYDMLLAKVSSRLRQTVRMKAKKQDEYVKLYKAFKAELAEAKQSDATKQEPSEITNEENFQWQPERPLRITFVGEGCNGLWDLHNLFRNAGHHTHLFTSGRSYLAKADFVKPQLTLIWPQTDDMNAAGVYKMLKTDLEIPHVLVHSPTNAAKAKLVRKEAKSDAFIDELILPTSASEIAQKVDDWTSQ